MVELRWNIACALGVRALGEGETALDPGIERLDSWHVKDWQRERGQNVRGDTDEAFGLLECFQIPKTLIGERLGSEKKC